MRNLSFIIVVVGISVAFVIGISCKKKNVEPVVIVDTLRVFEVDTILVDQTDSLIVIDTINILDTVYYDSQD